MNWHNKQRSKINRPLTVGLIWALSALSISTAALAGEYRFESNQKKVHLVELYTSQGCSSCPPAERWLGDFKNDPRLWKEIIPVAFHVTYWDYLGWSDPFAEKTYDQRQVAYKRAGHLRSVYTPGLVVNGNEWRGWFRGKTMPITDQKAGRLSLQLNNSKLTATYSNPIDKQPLYLNVVILGVDMATQVKAGENEGKRLTQDFVALHYERLPARSDKWQTMLPVLDSSNRRLAVAAWITTENNRTPQQATGGWITF
jgi:hypothetical protein